MNATVTIPSSSIGTTHQSFLRKEITLEGRPMLDGYPSVVTFIPSESGEIRIDGIPLVPDSVQAVRSKIMSTLTINAMGRSIYLIEHVLSAIGALGLQSIDITLGGPSGKSSRAKKALAQYMLPQAKNTTTALPAGDGSMGWVYDGLKKETLATEKTIEYIDTPVRVWGDVYNRGGTWEAPAKNDTSNTLHVILRGKIGVPERRYNDIYTLINAPEEVSGKIRHAKALGKYNDTIKWMVDWMAGYDVGSIYADDTSFQHGQHWLASDLLGELFAIFGNKRLRGILTFNDYGSHASRLKFLHDLKRGIRASK